MTNQTFTGNVSLAILVIKALMTRSSVYTELDVQILETIRADFGDQQEVIITTDVNTGKVMFKIVTDDDHLIAINQLRQHLEENHLDVQLELLQPTEEQLIVELTYEPKEQEMNKEKKHSWKEEIKAEAEQVAESQTESQQSAQKPSMISRIAITTVKVAAVAGIAYGAFRLYQHFTSAAESTEV